MLGGIRLYTFLLLIAFLRNNPFASRGFGLLHFHDIRESEGNFSKNYHVKTIEQNLDHFDYRNNKTWQQRYLEDDKYFNESGPVFIMLGGEGSIGLGPLEKGLFHDLAKEHKGMMFMLEHRYYGASKPTGNISTDNLKYLSVEQALADIANFIQSMKSSGKMTDDNPVIIVGGSYAGNMAAWMKSKYGHLVKGAIASSAPVYAKTNFHEYYEHVADVLYRHSPKCHAIVKEAFDEIQMHLKTVDGSKYLQEMFNLCKVPNLEDKIDVAFFIQFLSELFAGTVQYNEIKENNITSIGSLCSHFTNEISKDSALERLSKTRKPNRCLSYENFIADVNGTTYENSIHQWIFQTCTEFGYYQIGSPKSIFGAELLTLDLSLQVCRDLFGEWFDQNLVDQQAEKINLYFGGRQPELNNVVFVNGDLDPWHKLSVLRNLSDSVTSIIIKGASHCADLHAGGYEIPELKDAKNKIKRIVASWLIVPDEKK